MGPGVLTEVSTLIGQFPSFSELVEKPDIRMQTNFVTAIQVEVMGSINEVNGLPAVSVL